VDTPPPHIRRAAGEATAFRTIEEIEPLERDLGKPLITNNQAILWACLRRAGLSTPMPGYGLLLREQ